MIPPCRALRSGLIPPLPHRHLLPQRLPPVLLWPVRLLPLPRVLPRSLAQQAITAFTAASRKFRATSSAPTAAPTTSLASWRFRLSIQPRPPSWQTALSLGAPVVVQAQALLRWLVCLTPKAATGPTRTPVRLLLGSCLQRSSRSI